MKTGSTCHFARVNRSTQLNLGVNQPACGLQMLPSFLLFSTEKVFTANLNRVTASKNVLKTILKCCLKDLKGPFSG